MTENNLTAKELDAIYNSIDELMMAGHYDLVDALLTVDVSKMPIVNMLGILTITMPCESYLLNRAEFFKRCYEQASTTKDTKELESLFGGLEHFSLSPLGFQLLGPYPKR